MSENEKKVFVIGAAASKVNRHAAITLPSTSVPIELLRRYSSPKPTHVPPSSGKRKAS